MSRSAENCRIVTKMNIPYLYTLRQTKSYAYTLPILFAYLNTYIPISIHALPILIHWLGFRLSTPYLNTLPTHLGSQLRILIHCRLVWAIPENPRQPIRIEYYVTRVVSQSESRTEKTHQLRRPIRVEYYVTRVVSQSKSNITSPESSRLGWKTLLGSRLESARCSLS